MTASPTGVPSSPKTGDGGNALAALFAAAAASSMHRQFSHATQSTTTTIATSSISKLPQQQKPPVASSATKLATTDKDSGNNAAQLLASLLNGASRSSTRSKVATIIPTKAKMLSDVSVESSVPIEQQELLNAAKISDDVMELRNLESWYDEDELKDDSCYQELVDSGNLNGWSADEMFRYNEKRHKIMSSYNEKTMSGKYTTPLPKNKSRTTVRLATQLAKEIEKKALQEGRITPESSDDDEKFESERLKRIQSKQKKQHSDVFKSLRAMRRNTNCSTQERFSNGIYNDEKSMMSQTVVTMSAGKSNKSSSQYSNSSTTPATASLSSSPTLNDSTTVAKPVTSSSRNILRTCLI